MKYSTNRLLNLYFCLIKWTAIILLINILSASLPMDWISFSSCCDEKMEICDLDAQDEEEKDCCEDTSCHCPCCHITNFFSTEEKSSFSIQNTFIEASYTYEFKYSMDSYGSLFRPPLL